MKGKRLYKSSTDKKICGVCGGLAEYLGIDSTIVRVIWAILILGKGIGLLLYIICAFVFPSVPTPPSNNSAPKEPIDVEYTETKD